VARNVTIENLGGPPADIDSIGKWVQANTITIAEQALTEEVSKGFDNEPVVVTDNVVRRDYQQVKPFGKIEFLARPDMAAAVYWALTELQKKSPVKTGRYASSHVVMLNGAEIQGNIWQALRNVKDGDRVQIVNVQPYAKKIEGRKGSRKRGLSAVAGLSKQAPRGVYERVVLPELIQRYGKSFFFDFKYVTLSTGVKVWGYIGGGRHKSKTLNRLIGQKARKRVRRDLVYPAIQFFIKPFDLNALEAQGAA